MIRKLLIAVALCAALGGVLYWSNKQQEAEDKKPAKDAAPRILAAEEGSLTQVTLKRKDGTETVIKKNGAGKWDLVAPKPLATDQDAVIGVLNNISSLMSDRVVEDKAADLSQFGLNPPVFEIDYNTKDGKTGRLLVGNDTPTGSNVFVALAGDPRVFTMSSSIKTSMDKTSQDLRDKRLLTFEADKITRIELDAAKKPPVEFGKNNQNEWTILKPQTLRADGFQVEELLRKVKDAKMDTAITDDDAKKFSASFAGGTPVAIAKVTDNSGTHTLEIRKAKDDYLAKSSAVDGIFKVTPELGTGVDKTIDDFRNKKLFDFSFSEPNAVIVPPVTYAKTGERWFAGTKTIDSTSLQNFIDKLRDLSASKFVDSGFTNPTFEVTVKSNEGKHSEKVLISKSGDNYFAKRDNEPAIYELDPKVATDLIKAAADVKEAQPDKKNDKKK